MEYRQHQLTNGLTVAAVINPRSYSAGFGYFVRAGSRDESFANEGVSHFLEHMVFKGTPTRSAWEVNMLLDELGSRSNAQTSEESTIYYAFVLPEVQTEIVELLTDLMRPSFRVDDFETEKKVIIEEIKMYADQPPYGGHEQIMRSYFGDHPLGLSILGTEDSVGNLSTDQMFEYFHSRYAASNMALIAAGKIDFDRLVEQVEQLCGDWPSVEPASPARQFVQVSGREGFLYLPRANSTQQYIMQISPGPSVMDEDRYAMRLLCSIVGEASSSRMYWDFLDKGLADSAGLGCQPFQDCGILMSFICCDPEQTEANLLQLERLQQQIRTDGVSEKELMLAKRRAASNAVFASESTGSSMFSAGIQWLDRKPYRSRMEIAERIERVTLQEVNDVIGRYPMEKSFTLSVGPNASVGVS